jgi:peptide/nickel transport system ATP-binding protein
MAVVGESGSGKTTLARCIVGLHDNWTGQMRYADQALAPGTRNRPKPVLEKIQYIFQNPYTSLNPRKTIDQIVGQPLEHFHHLPARKRTERVTDVLQEVNLGTDFLPRYPDQLSGGERQRVAIARALVVEPTLLVCDEVTSALDVSVQAVIVELLRRLQHERQLTMLFITHNLALVRSIAQTAVVLCNGRVVEAGSVQDIMERPSDPYTIRLLQDVPKLAHRDAARPSSSALAHDL